MKKLMLAAAGFYFATGLAFAQAPATSPSPRAAGPSAAGCEAKAMDKNGKPLSGAAKTSFMKKCEAGMQTAANCEAKAVDKNGKPLAGAAKASFMKKCEAGQGQ